MFHWISVVNMQEVWSMQKIATYADWLPAWSYPFAPLALLTLVAYLITKQLEPRLSDFLDSAFTKRNAYPIKLPKAADNINTV